MKCTSCGDCKVPLLRGFNIQFTHPIPLRFSECMLDFFSLINCSPSAKCSVLASSWLESVLIILTESIGPLNAWTASEPILKS